MQNIGELIAAIDARKTGILTAKDILSIECPACTTDNGGPNKTAYDCADTHTQPAAALVWEFNNAIFFKRPETAAAVAQISDRLREFVLLLERLKLSTQYDCFDSYGSQDADPRRAVPAQLLFEIPDEETFEMIVALIVNSGIVSEHDLRMEHDSDYWKIETDKKRAA